ncbi:uncharacterized protein [Spinacia oleracea]|uniref:Phosphorylated adapter RNA export protein n=1 Tax=Spinacia oleracea TaxID=3562 RepID=A0ABM3QXA9_SPIOL|nr:uncharacterized protein LOC130462995 [Spinacia oleracea]
MESILDVFDEEVSFGVSDESDDVEMMDSGGEGKTNDKEVKMYSEGGNLQPAKKTRRKRKRRIRVLVIQANGGQRIASGDRNKSGGGVLWKLLKARDPDVYKEIMTKGREFEKTK